MILSRQSKIYVYFYFIRIYLQLNSIEIRKNNPISTFANTIPHPTINSHVHQMHFIQYINRDIQNINIFVKQLLNSNDAKTQLNRTSCKGMVQSKQQCILYTALDIIELIHSKPKIDFYPQILKLFQLHKHFK